MAAFSHTSACIFLWAAFLVSYTVSAPAPVAEGDISPSQSLDYHNESGTSRCYYNFQHYEEGDRIVTNEPCLNCTCHKRMLMCYLRVCPFTKAIGQDCTVEKKPDQCCPVITCPQVPVDILTSSTTEATTSSAVGHLSKYGCTLEDNTFYPDGVQMPSDHNKPCELCYCIRNQTACVRQECTLNVEGCRPVYQEGVCCPVRYDCDYNEIGTTERPSTGGLQLGTTASPLQCTFGHTMYNDGELIDTDKPCESCYCMRGDIVCAVRSCGEPLEGSDCEAIPPPPGQCCPTTYKCANGTFPVEELVTQNSLLMHPGDLQTHKPTEESNHDQPIEDATKAHSEETTSEEEVKKEDEVLPTEEEKEPEKHIEDKIEQTDATDEHIEADPVDEDELETDHTLVPSPHAESESDDTNVASNSPVESNEHLPTPLPEADQETHADDSSKDHSDVEETPSVPEDQSSTVTDEGSISSEAEAKPEENVPKLEENTTDGQFTKNEHEGEAGSGDEVSATESYEGSTDVPPAEDKEPTHIGTEGPKDEQDVPEVNTEQDSNKHQDEDEESDPAEHAEHDPSFNEKTEPTNLGVQSSETEPTVPEIEQKQPEASVSESEGNPDNAGDEQSTDTPNKESDLKPEPESDNNQENENILIHEESATNVPKLPEAFDQTQEVDATSHSGIEPESDLTKPDIKDGTDTLSNDDKHVDDSTVDALPEQEHNEVPVDSLPKEPIPSRKDDAALEEHEHEYPQHPEGSMTKAEDSIPEDQTPAALPESELPKEPETVTNEDPITTSPNNDEVQPAIDAASNNVIHDDPEDSSVDSAEPEIETVNIPTNVEPESLDSHNSKPQDSEDSILGTTETVEVVNEEYQTVPPVSNAANDEQESEPVPDKTKPDEISESNHSSKPQDTEDAESETTETVEVVNGEDQTASPVSNAASDEIENEPLPDKTKTDETTQGPSEASKPNESEEVINEVGTKPEQENTNEQENGTETPTINDSTEGSSTTDIKEQPANIVPETEEQHISENEKSPEPAKEEVHSEEEEVHSEEDEKEATSQQEADTNKPDVLSSVPNDGSSVSLADNTESSSIEETAEESTNKIQPEVNDVHEETEGKLPESEHPEETTHSIAEEPSVPEKDVEDHEMPGSTSSEQKPSEPTSHQPDELSEGAQTESPVKEVEGESDEVTKTETKIKPEEAESTKEDGSEFTSPSEPAEPSDTQSSSSLPEHSHDGENTDESELQEVPHDPVESDPADIEEEEVAGEQHIEHEPSENEITDDHMSGHGGAVEHDTSVKMPGPIGVVPGEGDCLVDGQTYTNNSKIPSRSPCHKECSCLSSIVHCQGIDCPPPPLELANCMPVHQGDLCCPVYTCDGDTPKGPESHNQIGAVEETTGQAEEHTLAPSDTEHPTEGETSDDSKPPSKEEPLTDRNDQTTGSVVEESVKPTEAEEESEPQTNVNIEDGNESNQKQTDSEDLSQSITEENVKPNLEESSTNQNKENGPIEETATGTANTEEKHDDEASGNDKVHEETTDLGHEETSGEKDTSDTIPEAQDKPTDKPEESTNKQPGSDELVSMDTSDQNKDNSESQDSVVTEEVEGHHAESENQGSSHTEAEELPPKHDESVESETESTTNESDGESHKNETDVEDESQSPSADKVHDADEVNSEVATETSHSSTVSSEPSASTPEDTLPVKSEIDSSDEINTPKPEEQPVEGHTDTAQDILLPSSVDENQSTSDQDKQHILTEETQTQSGDTVQTNEESGTSPSILPTEQPESSEAVHLPVVESDDSSSQGENVDEDNVLQESGSDANEKPVIPLDDTNNQSSYATEEPHVPAVDNLATANPFEVQNSSQQNNVPVESEQTSNESIDKQDESNETESPEHIPDSTGASSSEGEVAHQETTETSQSGASPVENDGTEKHESLDAEKDAPESELPEGTQMPIVEEQQPIVDETTDKHSIQESNISETDNNSVGNSGNDKNDQSESTESNVVGNESESGAPDKASDDSPINNDQVETHDSTGESDIHNEEVTEISANEYHSSTVEASVSESEPIPEINIEDTKETESDEEPTATEGYVEKVPVIESDDLKTDTDSTKIQSTEHQEDSAPLPPSPDKADINGADIEGPNTPLHEISESDQQVPHSETSVHDGDQSPTPSESETVDQKPESIDQSSETPEQSVTPEETTGAAENPTETDGETEQSVAGEEAPISEEIDTHQEGNESALGENETSEHDTELDHSEIKPAQGVEGVHIVESDQKEDDPTNEAPEPDNEKDKTAIQEEEKPSIPETPATSVPETDDQKNEEAPAHEAEPSAQGVETANINIDGHSDQDSEHTNQESDTSDQSSDSSIHESDNSIAGQIQPDQETEHSDHTEEEPTQESVHTPEQPTQESEQPNYKPEHHIDHIPEQAPQENEEIPHSSSQPQDSSSLPIPSEETHEGVDESKPDINKPDPEIPAEDQFPSSPDMDYDVTEDGAFGPGTCRYGGKVYVSAQQIPRDDPCDFCFCFRSDIICLQQSCPPPIHRCHQEPIQGYCCPRYQCPVSMATSLNLTTTTTTTTTTLPPHFFAHAYLGAARQAGCLHKGRAFSVGEEITTASGPCLHCICGADGQMRCDPIVCSPEPQLRRMMEAAISHRRR